MKKKTLLLAGLCAISLCSWNAQAISPKNVLYINEASNIPYGAEEIILNGKLDYNAGPDDIKAGATDDAIYVQFNQSFGNVSISIYNGMGGLVYNTVVNTDVQQTVIIPFASAASGTYTVELNNANGYADGEFIKD